jgi:hypothetical protein
MEKSMLDKIALDEVSGLINDLLAKLSGPKGRMWLSAFKRFLRKENPWLANPFEQTVEEQLAILRKVNEFWQQNGHPYIEDIDAVCKRLAESAPEWPEGRDSYRSLRIRFGKGRDGMIKTFEAHAAAVKHVHDKFWRWEHLLSGEHPHQGKNVDRLRLLAGDDNHRPVVEWIIIPDLQQHRKRDSITSVRGSKSLADEGLVLAWLVPDRVCAINYKEWRAWFCAGYELNVPGHDDEPWRRVVVVGRRLRDGAAGLSAGWRSCAYSIFSVPSAE